MAKVDNAKYVELECWLQKKSVQDAEGVAMASMQVALAAIKQGMCYISDDTALTEKFPLADVQSKQQDQVILH